MATSTSGFDFYAGLQAVISDNQVKIIATSGEEPNPLLRNITDREGKRFPAIHRDQLERPGREGRHAAETLAALNRHINAALSDPALLTAASALGMDARGSTPRCATAWRRIFRSGRR